MTGSITSRVIRTNMNSMINPAIGAFPLATSLAATSAILPTTIISPEVFANASILFHSPWTSKASPFFSFTLQASV